MKIKSKLLLIALVPMFISGFIISTTSILKSESYLINEQETILKIAVEGFTDDVNAYKDDNVDITVFEGDTRVESSIEGAVGTKASDIVVEKVLKNGEIYFDTNVNVNGTPYYGYYEPIEGGMLFAGKPSFLVKDSINELLITNILIGIVSILLFFAFAYFISMHMAKRIQGVSKAIKVISDGDLSVNLNTSGAFNNDEIEEIASSTQVMIDKLKEMISSAKVTSKDVSSSSEELNETSETTLAAMDEVAKAVEEIAIGLQSQNESVQSIVESVSSINDGVSDIRSSANEISKYTSQLDDSSASMKDSMNNMSNSNQKLNESISDTSVRINEINKVIEKVKGIISVIGDISDQTKLLSLNASIEAARAGEAGKGFAVVAHSISDLSADTQKQVGEITSIITTLINDFEKCVVTLEEAVNDSEEQNKVISNVLCEFERLSVEIAGTSERVQLITNSVDKASSEMSTISQEVEELSSIAENSAAITEEVNASVEEINALMNGVASTASQLSDKSVVLNDKMQIFKF